jgi:hypothetical protein
MNLDELLSKYLDGDLSHEEDEQLRFLLAEEDDAKEEFDAAVLLNAAIKEDAASIKAPAAVLQDTEDKIAMAIMSRRDTGVSAFYRRRKYYSYAAVLLLFLIGTFYRIYDSYPFDRSGVMAESMAELKTQLLSQQFDDDLSQLTMTAPNEMYKTVKTVSTNSGIKKTTSAKNDMAYAKSSNMSETSIVNSETSILNNDDVSADMMFSAKYTPEPASSEIALFENYEEEINDELIHGINLKDIPSAPMALTMQPTVLHVNTYHTDSRSILMNTMPFYDFYTNSNNILASSFLGTEVMNTGIETNKDMAVSHVSQSIAYALNSENAIGVEVGLSQYSYDEVGSITYSVEDHERIDVGMEIENYQFGNLITEKIVYDRTKDVFWASVFYERQKEFSDSFTINGRLGLGANSEGPLGYTRLFARLGIYKGIFLTAGMEGRLFYLDLPELTTTDPKMRGSLIFSYGLQFIF